MTIYVTFHGGKPTKEYSKAHLVRRVLHAGERGVAIESQRS